MKKIIPGLLLAAAAFLGQGCSTSDEASASGDFDGAWLVVSSASEYFVDGELADRDSSKYDTADVFAREFLVIREGTLLSLRYTEDNFNNADFTVFRRIKGAKWIVAERDTLIVTRSGSQMVFLNKSTFEDFYEGEVTVSTRTVFKAYKGKIPPVEWAEPHAEDPGETMADAIHLTVGGGSQSGYLDEDDADWYSFTAVAGKSYFIETTGSTDTYLSLYDDDEDILDENDDWDDTNAGIEWTCPVSGTYYFKVTGYDELESGAYGVSVSQISGLIKGGAAAKSPAGFKKKHPWRLRALSRHE